jgi:hypothetical protein
MALVRSFLYHFDTYTLLCQARTEGMSKVVPTKPFDLRSLKAASPTSCCRLYRTRRHRERCIAHQRPVLAAEVEFPEIFERGRNIVIIGTIRNDPFFVPWRVMTTLKAICGVRYASEALSSFSCRLERSKSSRRVEPIGTLQRTAPAYSPMLFAAHGTQRSRKLSALSIAKHRVALSRTKCVPKVTQK